VSGNLVAEGYASGFYETDNLLWLHIHVIVSHDDLRLQAVDADVDHAVNLGDIAQGFGDASATVAPRTGEADKSNSCFGDRHRGVPVVGEPKHLNDISISHHGGDAGICGVM
jgi:hypothetical protein